MWAFSSSSGVRSYLRVTAPAYRLAVEHFGWSKIRDPGGMNARLWDSDFHALRGAYSYCCDVPVKAWV